MTIRDLEVIELLADRPELLAIADAVSATQHVPATPMRRWVSDVPALLPPPLRRVAKRRLLVGLSAAAAAVVATGVAVGLLVTAASPPSAYAAATKAMAATAATASGTMTLSAGRSSSIGGGMSTVATVRWNGKDLALASGPGGNVLPGFDQLRLVGGAVYLQRADGSWLHYASEADLGSSLEAGIPLDAFALAVGGRAAQIIASANGLQPTKQRNGSTLYSGSVPANTPGNGGRGKDLAGLIVESAQGMLASFPAGGTFEMVVGADGLVRQLSETAAPPATGGWMIAYSQLDSTASITPPASSAEGTAADLPTPPHASPPTGTAPQTAPTAPAKTAP